MPNGGCLASSFARPPWRWPACSASPSSPRSCFSAGRRDRKRRVASALYSGVALATDRSEGTALLEITTGTLTRPTPLLPLGKWLSLMVATGRLGTFGFQARIKDQRRPSGVYSLGRRCWLVAEH